MTDVLEQLRLDQEDRERMLSYVVKAIESGDLSLSVKPKDTKRTVLEMMHWLMTDYYFIN